MSTKFVSKNSNYMIVLRPGVEGNRTLGTHSISGLYVKFQDGVVDVKDDVVVGMLREHPGLGRDFVEVKQNEVDPFIDTREEIEPVHTMTEIKYGHAEGKTATPAKVKMTPQLKKVIEKEAVKMIPGILKSNPQILKDIITSLSAEMQAKEAKMAEAAAEKKAIEEGAGTGGVK